MTPASENKRFERITMHKRLGHFIIIAMLTVIAYAPVFTGDFIFDDQSLIRDNPYITRLQSLDSYLSQQDGIVDPQDQGFFHTGYYRPLLNITYFLDYKIWGMKAYGFRMTNLILHLAVCLMLYALLLRLSRNHEASFWAVLLFALHPVQTESVSIIVSRNNILSTLFMLASLYAYLVWWRQRAPWALAVALAGFTGAVFSKEFGLMLLPILFLSQRFITGEKDLKREAASYVPFLMIAVIYFALRKTVVHTPLVIPDDILMRLAYVPYLLAYNLKLVFLPWQLHSFSVDYPSSLTAVAVPASFMVLAFVAGLLYVLRREPLVLFSATAFAVSLTPVLNLVAKASMSLIAMRWLYLPLSLLSVGVAWLLGKTRENHKRVVRIGLAALATFFMAYSCTLNAHLWRDHETFLRQEVLHFANDLYLGDYAEVLLKKKRYPEAEHYLQQALARRPRQAYNYINYGALLIETQRPGEALVVLEKARVLTMVRKDRSDWNNNMGSAWALLGDYGQAHTYLAEALLLNPQSQAAHRNLASLLTVEGRTFEASEHLKAAEKLEGLK
jgi:tetratricopeptide (TPR) repeat protein